MPFRRPALFLFAVLACGAGPLLVLGFGSEEAAPAPPVLALAQAPDPAPEARPVEQAPAPVTLDDPALLASLERIALRALEQASRPPLEAVLEGARGRGPGYLLVALENHLRVAPEDGAGLVECMRREADTQVFFVMARAVGRTLDDSRVRASTLQLLREIEPARRADGLVALMGRSEPEVVALLLEVLESDPSDLARVRAASLLAYVLDEVEPADAQRAERLARSTLATPQATGLRVTAAAEILGRAGAEPQDMELLRAELLRTQDPEVLASLAYGLASGGLQPSELRNLLRSRVDEPRLEGVVSQLLAAMAQG